MKEGEIICYQYRDQSSFFPQENDKYKFYNTKQMDGKVWIFGSIDKKDGLTSYPPNIYSFPVCAWKIKAKLNIEGL